MKRNGEVGINHVCTEDRMNFKVFSQRFFHHMKTNVWAFRSTIFLVLAPILLASVMILGHGKEARCAYVILVMAAYWMTEVVPLAITALIPVFGLPLLGVMSTSAICVAYMNQTIMFFLGGLMVATSVEYSGLHRRIALFVILKIGQSPRRLMAGFMLTTMLLSMWISNTASTAMMIPIVEAIVVEIIKDPEKCEIAEKSRKESCASHSDFSDFSEAEMKEIRNGVERDIRRESPEDIDETSARFNDSTTMTLNQRLKTMSFLSVAYSANLGGTGTVTGTGPNLVLIGELDRSFSEESGLNFASWMAFNVPGMLVCCFFAWVWLQIQFIGIGRWSKLPTLPPEYEQRMYQILKRKYESLGKITFHEKAVLGLFIVMVLSWLLRSPGFMTGWSVIFTKAFGDEIVIRDASTALLAVFLLFVIPAKPNFWPFRTQEDIKNGPPSPSGGCLTWQVVHTKCPWDIILIISGGIALAQASEQSGLSLLVREKMEFLEGVSGPLLALIVSLIAAMVTEVVSNVATASILMPLLKELSLKICVNPLYLMLSAALSCSFAFMLPVATAPNALAFTAAKMRISDMVKAGFVMNVACILIVNIMINTLGVPMFDIHNVPAWVNSTTSEDRIISC